jgi:site-specific DNA recombinase
MQSDIEKLREENQKLKEEIEKLKRERGNNQKKGMLIKASNGKIMSRAPFGYNIINNELIVNEENARKVEEVFDDFLNSNLSLNKLAQKYGFSVNGVKKILTNFSYIGKIKFSNQIHDGKHKPILSSTLFNHVQDKLEKRKVKN